MRAYPTTWEPSQHVSVSIHHDGIVFLHVAHGRLFTANPVGARVWRALEQGFSPEAIAEDLSREYHVPLASAHAHTTRFIAQLESQHLIARRPIC